MTAAEVLLGVDDLHAEMPFFQTLGFRLDMIWPADDPATAIMSGYGLRLRLERGQGAMPGRIRILADDPAAFISDHGLKGVQLASPSGNLVMIAPSEDIPPLPEPERGFAVRRLVDGAEWVIGRAGMRYRDLIPNRLGGSIIASHIRIPEGGPVPDMVHFHRIGFQLIFCHAGWVDLVYEDQGPEFRLSAGDCVIQPPEIRHRVLHASDGLEVIEIGCPAEHVTAIDHEMTLPTPHHRPGREFGGQVFLLHREGEAEWKPWSRPGFRHRDTGVADATRGVAAVHVARPDGGGGGWFTADADIHFTFLRAGTMKLEVEGEEPHRLSAGDAFVIPSGSRARYSGMTADLELLEVTLPGTGLTPA